MTTGFVSREHGSLTVRLPEDTSLPEGVVDIRVEGNGIVLTPSSKTYGMRLLELMEDLGDSIEVPEDLPPQQREAL